MNIPDPKTLTSVAKTLQNGSPENTLTAPPALPISGAFEINKAPWINEGVANIKPMPGLFEPAGFKGNLEGSFVQNVENFEKEARARTEVLKKEFPPTPLNVDTSKWDTSNMTEESLAAARKQLAPFIAWPDNGPSGP